MSEQPELTEPSTDVGAMLVKTISRFPEGWHLDPGAYTDKIYYATTDRLNIVDDMDDREITQFLDDDEFARIVRIALRTGAVRRADDSEPYVRPSEDEINTRISEAIARRRRRRNKDDNSHIIWCLNDDCEKRHPKTKWDRIRAIGEGWFVGKDGRAWCSDHLPDWVYDWRAKEQRLAKPGPSVDPRAVLMNIDDADGVGWPTEFAFLLETQGAELAGLLADIAENGVQCPIVVDFHTGTMVDGVHRLMVALLLGLEVVVSNKLSDARQHGESIEQHKRRGAS